MGVLDGNPAAAGGVYTLRLKFPAGYRFPSHWHPKSEHLTVISGSFQLGMGTTEDRSMEKTYGPGDFLMIPGRHPHYGGASQETVVQLHGVGPFQIFLSKGAAKTKADH
jgi:quercetin dioxygenase-like cupin family protein